MSDKVIINGEEVRIHPEFYMYGATAALCDNSDITPIDVKRIRRKIRYTDISDEYF